MHLVVFKLWQVIQAAAHLMHVPELKEKGSTQLKQVVADCPQVAHVNRHGIHLVLLEITKPTAHVMQLVWLQFRQLGWHVVHIEEVESKANPLRQPKQVAGADEKSKYAAGLLPINWLNVPLKNLLNPLWA